MPSLSTRPRSTWTTHWLWRTGLGRAGCWRWCETVLHDEDDGIFKMWYRYWSHWAPGYIGADGAEQVPMSLYATSEDGVNWEKPLVGTVPLLRGERFGHNVVATVLNANVIKDKGDPDPDRRYKMICCSARCRAVR